MLRTSETSSVTSDEVFSDPAANEGGGRFGPPAICQMIEPILDPKKVFDNPVRELSEYVAKFYLKVTDDGTGGAQLRFFTVISDLARQSSRI